MRNKILIALIALSVTSVAFAQSTLINGAGATFPYPLYSKWFSEYKKINKDVEINYQSIGSGGGIRQLLDKTVDFGASDAPMTDEQLAKSAVPIAHIPTVLGAVVLTYNVPGLTDLKLTPELVADIFLGKITKWEDPKIAAENPGAKFPKGLAVMVAQRSDGSGTTAIFTDYLSKISAHWKSKVGNGPSVKWPVGLGGKGNEGVTGLIKQTPGSIGYVELIYAESNKLSFATLKNQTGAFVKPSVKSVTAAAAGFLKSMPADFRVSITNAPAKDAYPISGFTYLLVYQKMDAKKGPLLKTFLQWALTDGQKMAEVLFYAPLPKELAVKALARVKELKSE